MNPRENRSAAALLTALANRQISAETLARSCLERAAELDPKYHLFAHLDPAQVLAQARALDQSPARGPLHGLPIGVKDVIDTRDMPTAYGSTIYAGHRPKADAAVVAVARRQGALMFGKTITTEFATMPPGPTANPRNPAHTPGGSSSGSAAAVACGVLPAAFGTQTSGSVIRPAAFCGVVGYKPSYGTLPRVGVKMISDTLDTVGLFAGSVADAALIVGVLAARDGLRVPEEVSAPRLAICLTPQWTQAEPETEALFDLLKLRISKRVSLPASFDGLSEAHAKVWDYELARCLADEYQHHRDQIREPLRSHLERGWSASAANYDAGRKLAAQCRAALAAAMGNCDALVVPAATGEAPEGLQATGNPVFNRMWTLLHVPCVHVPIAKGPRGLPLGVQVVGRIGDDARVLAAAHWIEKNLREGLI